MAAVPDDQRRAATKIPGWRKSTVYYDLMHVCFAGIAKDLLGTVLAKLVLT